MDEQTPLGGAATIIKNYPMSLNMHQMGKDRFIENMECISCGGFIDVCPENMIHFSYKQIE